MTSRSFGAYVRQKRLALLREDMSYSLRRVALAVGLEPSFLSKIERGVAPPPSELKIKGLAGALGEDPDVLLALAGKISTDLHDAIRKELNAQIGELKAQAVDAAYQTVIYKEGRDIVESSTVPYAESRRQLDAARQSFRELNRRLRKASFETDVAYADE